MEHDNAWISNGYRKIKNPIKYSNTTDKYSGPLLDNFDFNYQTENFNIIKESVEQFQIYPDKINYAKRFGKAIFVVCFSDPKLLWYKYEGELPGSGQNYIYYGETKYKTTEWLTFNQNKIKEIIFKLR